MICSTIVSCQVGSGRVGSVGSGRSGRVGSSPFQVGLGRALGEGQCWVEWGRVGSGRVRVGSGRHQLAGGILKAVADGLNTMVKEPVLAKCLFEFPTHARLTHMNVEDVLACEDEAALTFAKLNLATAFCRIKRLTFMLLGPSPNSVFFAGGDVCEKEALARLQRDVDNDIYFRSIADDVTGIRELVDRSVFDWIANKQIVGVLKAVDFRPTTDTHNFFRWRTVIRFQKSSSTKQLWCQR